MSYEQPQLLYHPKFIVDSLLARGLTQTTIAILSGTSQGNICRVHSGDISNPRWNQVLKLNEVWRAYLQAEGGGQ